MSKKILIIEDDSFLQGLASTKLEKEGFTVRGAANGEEGIKLLSSESPDLVLCDLIMPGTDGFAVLEAAKKDPALAKIPIIVFSNLSEDKDIKRAKELGAVEYMVKSNFTLDELADKIKSILK